jgi:hypothetical protein
MSIYTVSWYVKEDGRWVRCVKVCDELEKAKIEYERLFPGGYNTPDKMYGQIESGTPALPYHPPKPRKNTNAWKPKRCGA